MGASQQTSQLRDTRQRKRAYLHESQLFARLTDAQLRSVEQATAMSHCERGRIFFSPQDKPGTVYVLKSGSVRLYRKDDDGRELTVALLDAGSVFGESSLLGQSHAGVWAQALDDCVLCVMPAGQLHELVISYPQIGINLLSHVGEQLRRTQELSHEIAYWTVQRRLAARLVALAQRYGRSTLDGHVIIEHTFTQAQLAEMIGATRQTVSDLMRELASAEVVEIRRRRIVIVDEARLRDYGAPAGHDGS